MQTINYLTKHEVVVQHHRRTYFAARCVSAAYKDFRTQDKFTTENCFAFNPMRNEACTTTHPNSSEYFTRAFYWFWRYNASGQRIDPLSLCFDRLSLDHLVAWIRGKELGEVSSVIRTMHSKYDMQTSREYTEWDSVMFLTDRCGSLQLRFHEQCIEAHRQYWLSKQG